jgi:hypothetical protein
MKASRAVPEARRTHDGASIPTDPSLDPVSPPSADNLSALLAALDEEARGISERRARIEKAFFDERITAAKTILAILVARGHELSHIAKALGFQSKRASISSSKPSGPTNNHGWFQLFRSRAVQTWLKAHPELLASLKTRSVPLSEYSSHIPTDDLKTITMEAQSKADTRCPSAPSAVS